jgi:hypothetical protein
MLGKRTPGREPDKLLIEHIGKCYVALRLQCMAARHHDHEPIDAKGICLQPFGAGQVSEHTDIGVSLGYGWSYLVTDPLLQRDIDARIPRKPAGQNIRKVLFQCSRIRHQSDMATHPSTRMFAQIAAQSLHLRQNELGVVTERRTGRCRPHASSMAFQQGCSKRLLHPFHAGACGGKRNGCARRASGDAALFDHGGEQAQIGQIEMHGTISFG